MFTQKIIKDILVKFVCESTNILSSHDPNHFQIYSNLYYKVLEEYDNTIYLKINADKSNLMNICRQHLRKCKKCNISW